MSGALKRTAQPDAAPRHFLDLRDIDPATLRAIIDAASALKRGHTLGGPALVGDRAHPLAGRTLAMIFEKPSTRTRVSFEVAMKGLGGDTVILSASDMQLGRGETIADTARVLSRYVDAIMLRTGEAAKLHQLAANSTVPVINGLTDASHPCQLMADILTFEEHRGPIANQPVAWLGDGNNVARTWIEAATQFGFPLTLATPESLRPRPEILAWAHARGGRISLTTDPHAAVRDARCVVTDCWISMSDTPDPARHTVLAPYQVNAGLMACAPPDAIVMHCLPAHRGEEITADILDGPQSVVFDEAENRLHAQKAILAWTFGLIR